MIGIPRRLTVSLFAILACSCGNEDNRNVSEAMRRGIGAECKVNTDCITEGATCLTQFKGGYCGFSNCTEDADCPAGSVCVTHDDGVNYCFLGCLEKVDCNLGRTLDNESNCVGSVTFLSTTGDVLGQDEQAAFERFVQQGGGWVGIHSASPNRRFSRISRGQSRGLLPKLESSRQAARLKATVRHGPSYVT